MTIDASKIEAIAQKAIDAMERALCQAAIELTRHDQEFVPADEVSVARIPLFSPAV